MTLEEWAAKYVRGPVPYAKEYDEAIADFCATLRDQGWRVAKLEWKRLLTARGDDDWFCVATEELS